MDTYINKRYYFWRFLLAENERASSINVKRHLSSAIGESRSRRRHVVRHLARAFAHEAVTWWRHHIRRTCTCVHAPDARDFSPLATAGDKNNIGSFGFVFRSFVRASSSFLWFPLVARRVFACIISCASCAIFPAGDKNNRFVRFRVSFVRRAVSSRRSACTPAWIRM